MVLCMVSGSQHSDEAGHHSHCSLLVSDLACVHTVICVTTAPVTDNKSNRAALRTGYVCPPGHQVDCTPGLVMTPDPWTEVTLSPVFVSFSPVVYTMCLCHRWCPLSPHSALCTD